MHTFSTVLFVNGDPLGTAFLKKKAGCGSIRRKSEQGRSPSIYVSPQSARTLAG